MSHLSIEQASSNSSNLKDQVCIITGAGQLLPVPLPSFPSGFPPT
jgi:hypothetical protein